VAGDGLWWKFDEGSGDIAHEVYTGGEYDMHFDPSPTWGDGYLSYHGGVTATGSRTLVPGADGKVVFEVILDGCPTGTDDPHEVLNVVYADNPWGSSLMSISGLVGNLSVYAANYAVGWSVAEPPDPDGSAGDADDEHRGVSRAGRSWMLVGFDSVVVLKLPGLLMMKPEGASVIVEVEVEKPGALTGGRPRR
jgi:hypothetical protein